MTSLLKIRASRGAFDKCLIQIVGTAEFHKNNRALRVISSLDGRIVNFIQ